MKKVRFFRSIHYKFALLYVLLILIAMQIIGVYFIQKLEGQLVANFKVNLNERINLIEYSIEQEMKKERNDTTPTLEEDIRLILEDLVSEDTEVRIIDNKKRVIGSSDSQEIVGRRTTDMRIKRTLLVGDSTPEILLDPDTHQRMYVLSTPIHSNSEIIGAIYVVASMENVFNDIQEINDIFVTGIVIALLITALLGIFVAQTITRPISAMRKFANEMAKGNYSKKVKVFSNDEIGELAMSFNALSRKLQDAQSLTEGERRKLSSVITYMTDGVISTDKHGKIILINDPALEMLNVSRETALNKPIILLLGLNEKYTFQQLMREVDTEILNFSTKKNPYILKASFSPIQKDTGFANGLITVLYDITEQEKIDQERREFVANVSHELRTPLTTMRSYLEALADGAWKDEQIAPQFLHVTQTETERMIRLVNDLLKLSKLDSKDYHLEHDWIDFNRFFHKIIDRFELLKDQKVTFTRNIPDQEIFVEIDTDKITQVLDNIISNALKYSPEGGEVTFNLTLQNNFIEISISDEGVGIPKQNIQHIFERFYRVDKARSRKLGGTGLGLAIAKEMVVAHGGRIWANSEDGKGTTIYFTLPYVDELEDEWS